ncbi:MAG: endonuclease, partial [Bacteroidales bacterium]|nr:endonuclease [Bacteroidales bacterium]
MKRFLLIITSLLFLNLYSYSQIPNGYYDSANGLSGEQLKSALHEIINGHTELSYSDLWDVLLETDQDPNNSNNFILIYTGRSIPNTDVYPEWNREHVWAKSHGDFGTTAPAGTDAHHIRPSDVSVNGDRGNKDFDNGGTQHTEATECYWDSDSWEPRDAVKGDVARMMFYMAARYEGDASGEPDLELVDYITGSTSSPIFGVLSTLLEWNNQDPVDDFERNKNNVVYSYQNNRNPFIDHPEYVNQIWGGAIMNYVPSISDVTIIPSVPTANNTVSVSATITDSDGNITDAKLNWGTTSGDLTNEITMLVSNASTYISNSEIPAQADGIFVYYTISATDDSSATTTTSEYNYEVGNTTVTVLSEEFSSCPPSGWLTEDVAGSENWECSTDYMTINAYDGTGACDDWLITPSFDLDSYTEEILSFTSWTKYSDTYYPAVELKYSSDYAGSGDPTSATWNTLTSNWSVEDSETWTASGDIDISAISGANVYFAIQYTSSGNAGGTSTQWEIDDFQITGKPVEGNNMPSISSVSNTPTSPLATEDVSISATIIDSDGTISVAKVRWGTTSGNYVNNISMTANGDIYNGTLAAQLAGITVYYVVFAEDNQSGNAQSTEYSVSFSSAENSNPTITDITITPAEPTEVDTVVISANISDNDGTISSAVLKWKLVSSELSHEIDMLLSNEKYICEILPQHKLETVYFMITAIDNSGGETLYNDGRYYVNQLTGIEKLNTENISIFPNPADNYL